MKEYKTSIFIFRRDLRLEDNTGLFEALEKSETVVPVFIFDERQIDKKQNEYFSERSFQFMVRSLKELEEDLGNRDGKLYLFEGEYQKELEKVLKETSAEAVFVNKDYTPFARKRDKEVSDVCDENSADFYRIADHVLSDIENVKTGGGNWYTVFTPFMKKASEKKVEKPRKNNFTNYFAKNIDGTVAISKFENENAPEKMLDGGREEALSMMRADGFLSAYGKERDLPAVDGTSKLSAHLKFGTVSVREVYEAGAHAPKFISELYWRDFYMYISYHFPQVFEKSFQKRGDRLAWVNDDEQFEAWKAGKTGVPMVDAGMRQLNAIGWMHNRSRMIVASYLTKNLLIDWRWGEKYFAQNLVDYDPGSNNGGWQWSASVGADPKPIRVFNPFTQAGKYDPDAQYIKEWVPELREVEDAKLVDGKDHDFSEFVDGYPSPLVDQKETFHRAMEAYKEAKEK